MSGERLHNLPTLGHRLLKVEEALEAGDNLTARQLLDAIVRPWFHSKFPDIRKRKDPTGNVNQEARRAEGPTGNVK